MGSFKNTQWSKHVSGAFQFSLLSVVSFRTLYTPLLTINVNLSFLVESLLQSAKTPQNLSQATECFLWNICVYSQRLSKRKNPATIGTAHIQILSQNFPWIQNMLHSVGVCIQKPSGMISVADPGGLWGVQSKPPLAHSLVWKIQIWTFTFAQKYLSGNLQTPAWTPLHRILDPPQWYSGQYSIYRINFSSITGRKALHQCKTFCWNNVLQNEKETSCPEKSNLR